MAEIVQHFDFEYKDYKYSIINYGWEKVNISREFLEGSLGMNDWWCGYVFIPKGHKYYNKDYDDIPLSPHGGLTYAGKFHIKESKNKDKFAIGFDFNHYDDHGGSKQQVIDECKGLISELGKK